MRTLSLRMEMVLSDHGWFFLLNTPMCAYYRIAKCRYRLFIFLKIYFLESRREQERERNINVWLLLTRPLLGTWPATQACALTGNWTGHPVVLRPALNPLSHTSQGWRYSLKHTAFAMERYCFLAWGHGQVKRLWTSLLSVKWT